MSSRKWGGRGTARRFAALGGLILAASLLALPAGAQDFFQQFFGGGGGGGGYYSDYGYSPRHRREHRAWPRHRRQEVEPRRRAEPQPHPRRARGGGGAAERAVVAETPAGGRSYCVRECDGYFFPVGLYASSNDTASHQRACGRLCPGARTTLYVMRGGSDKIEDAVAARGGGSYARLMASAKRKAEGDKDKECSCHADQASESSIEAIYLDPTLRRGDAVMTAQGLQVFHGASRYPYSKGDFRPLSSSPDVDSSARRKLAAMERASRQGRGTVERRAARPTGEHRSQSDERSRDRGAESARP